MLVCYKWCLSWTSIWLLEVLNADRYYPSEVTRDQLLANVHPDSLSCLLWLCALRSSPSSQHPPQLAVQVSLTAFGTGEAKHETWGDGSIFVSGLSWVLYLIPCM